MANWIENSLIITGETEDVKKFFQYILYTKKTLVLTKPKKYVKVQNANVQRGDIEHPSDPLKYICLKQLPWNLQQISGCIEGNLAKVQIHFSTKWAPPIDNLIEISKLFISISMTLEFCDPMNFVGSITINNGEIVDYINEYVNR